MLRQPFCTAGVHVRAKILNFLAARLLSCMCAIFANPWGRALHDGYVTEFVDPVRRKRQVVCVCGGGGACGYHTVWVWWVIV